MKCLYSAMLARLSAQALRLVKHLCLEGSPHFQRAMQQHAACIRDLTQYKGEPDPFKVKGDHFNEDWGPSLQRYRGASCYFRGSLMQPKLRGGCQVSGLASVSCLSCLNLGFEPHEHPAPQPAVLGHTCLWPKSRSLW